MAGGTSSSAKCDFAAVSPYGDFTVHIPQKALLKNYLTVSAEAATGTVCRLIYVPPSGEFLQMEATADLNGLCEWRWKIEEFTGQAMRV